MLGLLSIVNKRERLRQCKYIITSQMPLGCFVVIPSRYQIDLHRDRNDLFPLSGMFCSILLHISAGVLHNVKYRNCAFERQFMQSALM